MEYVMTKKLVREGLRYDEEDLPEELWRHIMCFLPVTCLLILRSVCKSFLSIIDDSSFVSLHLRSHPDNLHETLTLVHTYVYNKDGTCQNHYDIRESNGLAPRQKLYLPGSAPSAAISDTCGDFRSVAGSLDGLYLLESLDWDDQERVGTLWNPSTRQIRVIPSPNPDPDNNKSTSKVVMLAYESDSDSSCRYYKVIYITYDSQCRPSGVYSYCVGTRSWATISMANSGICTLRVSVHFVRQYVCFEGALLWTEPFYSSHDDDAQLEFRMVRFEVGTCKFRYYTNFPIMEVKSCVLKMIDGGSTLGFIGLDDHDRISVWALDGLDGDVCSWVKRWDIPQFLVKSTGRENAPRVSKNDELIWMERKSDGVMKVVTYNLRNRHCHESGTNPSTSPLYKIMHEGGHWPYIQSLIKF